MSTGPTSGPAEDPVDDPIDDPADDPATGAAVAELAGRIAATDRLVVLTGAGVSTASGIPDYRGPTGVWTRDPAAERRATIGAYVADVEVRRAAWRTRLASTVRGAVPNDAHHALVELERRGHLAMLVTQNVDRLHHRAGGDPDRIVEVHGHVHGARCLDCDRRVPLDEVLDRVRAGEDDPRCLACGGLVTTTAVAFGESLDPDVLGRAIAAAADAEVFLALGTSLAVEPVASLPRTAVRAGATLAIVTRGETPYDAVADVRLEVDAGWALAAILAAIDAT